MKLNKRQTYFALLGILTAIGILYQLLWIFSRPVNAEILDFTRDKTSMVNHLYVRYQAGSRVYYEYFLRDGYDTRNHFLKIRYLLFAPGITRTDSFTGNWGSFIMFWIVFFLIISIVFIRTDMISNNAVVVIQKNQPYISIRRNEIPDYDEHIVDHNESGMEELNSKLTAITAQSLDQGGAVTAGVYVYNPTAIFIFILYVPFFFWFIYIVLTMSYGYSGIFIFGPVIVFVPLFIRFTNNPIFKAEIPGPGRLSFSNQEISFKNNRYAVDEIESAVIYLEAFRGFQYRDRITTGIAKTVSRGDNNKISFRCKGEVLDFTFILDHPTDYWLFENLVKRWSMNGINIILEKAFEDDFIEQEMAHFNTVIN